MRHRKHILIAYIFHLVPIILGFVSGSDRFHFMGLCAIAVQSPTSSTGAE